MGKINALSKEDLCVCGLDPPTIMMHPKSIQKTKIKFLFNLKEEKYVNTKTHIRIPHNSLHYINSSYITIQNLLTLPAQAN